jgi:transposase InsO family protein
VDIQEQRMRFVIAASRKEKPFQQLCQEFQISRPTGYEWCRRYQTGGYRAVVEKSRRPRHSPQQTCPAMEQRVVELRQQRPDWGAGKLQVLLEQEGIRLPVITVHRILVRHQLVRSQDRHSPAVQRFERSRPNELWQMDFKSPLGWEAPTGPLSLLDDHSRYAVALQGTWTTRAQPVQQRLEEAFQQCGVPQAMLMDHGTPWWNMKAVHGATWLTVWLMKQGIRLYFSGYRHPQTQGKVERFHGAMAAALKRRGYPRLQERQRWLDEFRHEYNHVRPHEALGMQTPATVWCKSDRAYDPNPQPWQYEPGSELVKVAGDGQIWIERQRWEISRALVGEWVQLIRLSDRILVYYCRSLVRELDPLRHQSLAIGPDCKGCHDTGHAPGCVFVRNQA